MELRRLRYFLATANELSFCRAAELTGVNQSAVSRQIAALEDELGVTLFERRSTGARLTEVGRVFLADARRIVADVDRAREMIAAVAFGTEGRVLCPHNFRTSDQVAAGPNVKAVYLSGGDGHDPIRGVGPACRTFRGSPSRPKTSANR